MASDGVSRTLQALRQQRLHWVELEPGLRVQFRRPLETDLPRFAVGMKVEHVCEFVVGWEGFTEATFLGAAVGSSDPVDFSPELWAEYVRDSVEVYTKVANAVLGTLTAYLERREASAKN